MQNFAKLFQQIIHSTVWREEKHVKILWITFLAMKDAEGNVYASLPGLADAARITLPECEDGLARLKAPDPYSRTKEHGGRRIEEIDGGWRVINSEKYRRLASAEDRREQVREAVKRHRAKKKSPVITDDYSNQSNRGKPIRSRGIDRGIDRVKKQQKQAAALRFDHADSHTAYLQARTAARNPESFDAMLRTVHEPPTGGKGFAWAVIGQAILELQAAGSDVGAANLRGFCRRLTATDVSRNGEPSPGDVRRAALARMRANPPEKKP